jgi:hypothetical protein
MRQAKKAPPSRLMNPDERNFGGRHQITDLIYNHQKTLSNAKSTLKTFSDCVPKRKKQKNLLNEIGRFAEVFESFRRANNVKFSNFTSPPKTFNLTNDLQKRVPFKVRLENYNHALNLKSQKQKIAELDSINQRKKKLFDKTTNPSLFFRRTNKSTFWCKSSESNSKSKKLKNEEDEFVFDEKDFEQMLKDKKEKELKLQNQEKKLSLNSNPPNCENKNMEIEERKKHQRLNSALPRKKKEELNTPIEKNDNTLYFDENQEYEGLLPIPKINGHSEEDYENLKNSLRNIILVNKIFDADSLESLFGRTLLHNPNLEKEKIEEIFINVFEELERKTNPQ